MAMDAQKPRSRAKAPKSLKMRLAERFRDWPLIRLLILSFWFRLVVLGLLGTAVLIALALPKIWTTTPPDITPPVKVSLIDKIQSWSLKQRARASEANGDTKTALDAWRTAWANNYADVETIYGLLRAVPRLEVPEQAAYLVQQAGQWLEKLKHTNDVDVEMMARALANVGSPAASAMLLGSRGTNVPAQWTKLQLISLMQAGRVDDFVNGMATDSAVQADLAAARKAAQEYAEHSGSTIVKPDEAAPAVTNAAGADGTMARERAEPKANLGLEDHFDLFCLAYLYGWGPPETQQPALALLQSARTNDVTKALAFDLELRGRLNHQDVKGYGEALADTTAPDDRRAKVRQQTDYWLLLAALEGTNGVAKARGLAETKLLEPADLADAERLAKIYSYLENMSDPKTSDRVLAGKATGVLKQVMDRMGGYYSPPIVYLYAQLLTQDGQWKTLRDFANERLGRAQNAERFGGYGAYLAGVAELQPQVTNGVWTGTWTGDLAAFESAVTNAAQQGFTNVPGIALTVAQDVARVADTAAQTNSTSDSFGYKLNEQVYALLLTNKAALMNSPQAAARYTQLLLNTAVRLKRSEMLLEAAKTLYELQPRNPVAANNYAAALVTHRHDPTEAIRLTRAVFEANPRSKDAVLNHFSALVLNGRYADAEQMFAALPASVLATASNADATQYHLGMFEIYWKTGRLGEARRELKILREPGIWAELYRPAQVNWLEAAEKQLDHKAPSGR